MSFAQIFTDLENEANVKLAEVGSEIKQFFVKEEPIIVAEAEHVLRQLASLALSAVIAEAPKLISGQEKFGNAVASITQSVEASGKKVLIADAQLAVQAAFRTIQLGLSS